MPLSRNRIKYLASLKIKKFRNVHKQFITEGDKIVRDLIHNSKATIRQLIATSSWLTENQIIPSPFIHEIVEADPAVIERISSFETPPPALALLDIPEVTIDHKAVTASLSVALDTIQDPGNLGTIIRTADWFGIRNIFCSDSCADCYNPKAVQASMGAVINVRVNYVDLVDFLAGYYRKPDFDIYGTYMDGIPFTECIPSKRGILVFGNESRGISHEILPYIKHKLTIPPVAGNQGHVESLNVSSAVAIICSVFGRTRQTDV